MGNIQSNNKSKNLTQIIDYIATNFILTNNFKDFKNLTDQKYCNNLVILTSKIINNNLNYKQVQYLSQRIKQGDIVNEMTKDNVIFFEKDKIENIDIDSNIRKKRLCIGIAKFYIKIAHIYAAIVSTVNPTYNYKNENGEIQEVNLENKIYIPKYSNTKINRNNICSLRINSLLNKSNFDVNNNEEIKINPDFCDINKNQDTGKTKMLINEPGIPELSKLYYDKYDYNTGRFIGMTEKAKKLYENDVKIFYKTFTGKKNVPNNIKTFSDIPLKDFHNLSKCKNNGAYTQIYTGKKREKYFKKYAEHIEKMMKTTNENQNKLIKIIDKLFILISNKHTNKKEIIINPNLTYKNLDLIIEETKKPIINLYLKCEKDYLEGLNIFEAIVNLLYKETSQNQLINLENNINKHKQKQNIPSNTELIEQNKLEEKENINKNINDPIVNFNNNKYVIHDQNNDNIDEQISPRDNVNPPTPINDLKIKTPQDNVSPPRLINDLKIKTPQDNDLKIKTPQDNDLKIKTPQDNVSPPRLINDLKIKTPQDNDVELKTPQDNDVELKTPQDNVSPPRLINDLKIKSPQDNVSPPTLSPPTLSPPTLINDLKIKTPQDNVDQSKENNVDEVKNANGDVVKPKPQEKNVDQSKENNVDQSKENTVVDAKNKDDRDNDIIKSIKITTPVNPPSPSTINFSSKRSNNNEAKYLEENNLKEQQEKIKKLLQKYGNVIKVNNGIIKIEFQNIISDNGEIKILFDKDNNNFEKKKYSNEEEKKINDLLKIYDIEMKDGIIEIKYDKNVIVENKEIKIKLNKVNDQLVDKNIYKEELNQLLDNKLKGKIIGGVKYINK